MAASDSKRRLGLWSGTALVVANMIGVGVFTTSGFALADLGAPHYVMYAWAVGGLLALCGALSYAGLVRQMPESGGEYHYLSRTIHPLAGFLAGWVSLLAGFTGPIAASALGLQVYLAPSLGIDEAHAAWLGTGAIVVALAMHGIQSHHGVLVQNLAVALKLLLLLSLAIIAVGRLPELAPAARTASFDLGAFAISLVWISFAYSGWNATAYVSGEVQDPKRNTTRSLWLGCGAVTLVYLLLNFVFLYAAPFEQIAGVKEVGVVAARALGGEWFARAVGVVVSLALFTSISSMIMAGPRVYARMADDGVFPAVFRRSGDVPMAAVALQAGLAILVVWWTGLKALLGYIGFTLGLSTATAVIGLFLLRRRLGADAVPVWGYPVVPLLYVVMTLGAAGFMFQRGPEEAMWGLFTVFAGVPLYFLFRRLRSRR